MFGTIAKLFQTKTRPSAPKTRSVKLGVERFEDRTVPSTFTLNNGVLAINCTDANATVRVTQSNGVVSLQGASHGWYESAVRKIYVQGGPGTCTIDLHGVRTIPAEIHGGAGNDFIYGTQTSDVIYGGRGWNIMFGDGGNDVLHGTGSNNRLIADPGSSKLYGDAGLNFMDGAENRGGHPQYFVSNGTLDYAAEAYAPGNVYRPEHIKQGSQCYTCNFLAVLEGMAQSGVKFNNYIHFAGVTGYAEGIYDVSLYNGRQWINERVIFNGTTYKTDNLPTVNLASWATIMERAWEQFHGNTGGSEYEVLVALGRRPAHYDSFASLSYFNAIANSLAHGYTVAAGTRTAVATNILETTHAYAVLATGYNTAGVACVKLRNPWGFNLVGGNTQRLYDAEMWITWTDFVRNFKSFVIG